MQWDIEELRSVLVRTRGGPPVLYSYVATPCEAYLSPTGVLSWKWHGPAVQGEDQIDRASIPKPRKIDARLCERFADLADVDDEQIRRFAERWGPLRYVFPTITETVAEWRRFATLARALVRCRVAVGQGSRGQQHN